MKIKELEHELSVYVSEWAKANITQPYIIQQKPIIGIGYSFGEGTREITNYKDETLYVPGIILE